jgi:hypothetical protein
MDVKFVWNGIKVGGKLHRVFYSDVELRNHPAGTLTIYARDYKPLPRIEGLNVQNDSDSMTDYFETDRIRITPGNLHHGAVLAAIGMAKAHRYRMNAKRGR